MKPETVKTIEKVCNLILNLGIFIAGYNILRYAHQYDFVVSTILSVVGWLSVIYAIPAVISINHEI